MKLNNIMKTLKIPEKNLIIKKLDELSFDNS